MQIISRSLLKSFVYTKYLFKRAVFPSDSCFHFHIFSYIFRLNIALFLSPHFLYDHFTTFPHFLYSHFTTFPHFLYLHSLLVRLIRIQECLGMRTLNFLIHKNTATVCKSDLFFDLQTIAVFYYIRKLYPRILLP